MRTPKRKNAPEREPILDVFDDPDNSPIFTVSSKDKEYMWENIQTYQENGCLNKNLEDAEELSERYKLNGSDVVNAPLIQQRNLHKYNLVNP